MALLGGVGDLVRLLLLRLLDDGDEIEVRLCLSRALSHTLIFSRALSLSLSLSFSGEGEGEGKGEGEGEEER